ncbi:hypothetical protein REPUB_Repub02eG0039900 [Reevesia pubescens]
MTGIRGVLRDNKGVTKLVFSKNVGVVDSNVAELLAVKEAFLIFVASSWCNILSTLLSL